MGLEYLLIDLCFTTSYEGHMKTHATSHWFVSRICHPMECPERTDLPYVKHRPHQPLESPLGLHELPCSGLQVCGIKTPPNLYMRPELLGQSSSWQGNSILRRSSCANAPRSSRPKSQALQHASLVRELQFHGFGEFLFISPRTIDGV